MDQQNAAVEIRGASSSVSEKNGIAEGTAESAGQSNKSPPKREQPNALILKGGGVKVLAFAGALSVLERFGFKSFHTFVGTSAGSLFAVLLAAGYSADELKHRLKKTDLRTFRSGGWLTVPWRLLAKGGLYYSTGLHTTINELLNLKLGPQPLAKQMRDLKPKRAVVVACHSRLGRLVYDSKGDRDDADVAHAVRVSCSIPGYFVPAEEQGYRVYDGGILYNFPIDVYLHHIEHDPPVTQDDFIALYIGRRDTQLRFRTWIGDLLDIIFNRDDYLLLDKHAVRTVVIDTRPIRTTDFNLSDEEKDFLVAAGEFGALEFLASARPQEQEIVRRRDVAQLKVNSLRKNIEIGPTLDARALDHCDDTGVAGCASNWHCAAIWAAIHRHLDSSKLTAAQEYLHRIGERRRSG